MNGQRKLVAVALAAGLLFTAGCGDKDKKTVLGPNGEKVSVDEDGNGKISYDDGKGNKVEIDGDDGSYTVNDGNGNTSASTGKNAKLPDDWPDDLKPPKSVKLLSAITSTNNGKKSMIASGESETAAQDLYDGIKSQLDGAGYEISGDNFYSDGNGNDGGTISASNDDFDVSVIVGASSGPGSTGKTTISVTVSEKDG